MNVKQNYYLQVLIAQVLIAKKIGITCCIEDYDKVIYPKPPHTPTKNLERRWWIFLLRYNIYS